MKNRWSSLIRLSGQNYEIELNGTSSQLHYRVMRATSNASPKYIMNQSSGYAASAEAAPHRHTDIEIRWVDIKFVPCTASGRCILFRSLLLVCVIQSALSWNNILYRYGSTVRKSCIPSQRKPFPNQREWTIFFLDFCFVFSSYARSQLYSRRKKNGIKVQRDRRFENAMKDNAKQ